jgi:threonine synthase
MLELNKELTFSIPSGNFGHAYAGWTAKEMGLPIKRLLIATNTNDVLHQVFSTNNYAKTSVVQTLAPSMDISVASNFERLLYNLYEDDSSELSKNMRSFPENPIKIPEDKQRLVSDFFKSYKSDDQEILEQISFTYADIGYLLDPHTATGVRASNSIVNSDEPVITMGTAHPAKFTEAIEKAIPEYNFDFPNKVERLFEKEESFDILPEDYSKIKDFILSKAL